MLRLSALNPKLIDILAKDQLTLEAAKALTLSDDHAEQLRAFKASNGHSRVTAGSRSPRVDLQS